MTVLRKGNLRYVVYLGTTLLTASIATSAFLGFSATPGRGAGVTFVTVPRIATVSPSTASVTGVGFDQSR